MGGIATGSNIIGNHFDGRVTIDNDTVAYTVNDAIGSKKTFTSLFRQSPGSGQLTDVILVDSEARAADLTIFFFDTDIAGTTNNAAFAATDAEMLTCCGIVDVAAADWRVGPLNSVCLKQLTNLKLDSTTQYLYMQIMIRSATTWTGSSQLQVRLKGIAD